MARLKYTWTHARSSDLRRASSVTLDGRAVVNVNRMREINVGLACKLGYIERVQCPDGSVFQLTAAGYDIVAKSNAIKYDNLAAGGVLRMRRAKSIFAYKTRQAEMATAFQTRQTELDTKAATKSAEREAQYDARATASLEATAEDFFNPKQRGRTDLTERDDMIAEVVRAAGLMVVRRPSLNAATINLRDWIATPTIGARCLSLHCLRVLQKNLPLRIQYRATDHDDGVPAEFESLDTGSTSLYARAVWKLFAVGMVRAYLHYAEGDRYVIEVAASDAARLLTIRAPKQTKSRTPGQGMVYERF